MGSLEKENIDFESLQDELIQRELLHEKEKEDYIYKTKSKHFWNEKLIKLIIKKRRCKEFIEFINDMPCLRHISEKIVEIQKNTESSSSDLSVAVPISDELLQEHLAIFYNELEPREIADEMFQAGHINVSDHDDVTECPMKWKRMECLLNILKKNKLYTPFGYTLSLKYVEVLDVIQQGKETTSITSDHAQCIQHNFTLLQEELPGTDIATVTMERILDESNISDIECCPGAIRQKSKLLKILLMKGNSACMELLRVVEVDLKREDLLQTMKKRSANIKERGKPKLPTSLQRLDISCLQEHKKVLHDELDPFDHSDLLFEERAIEIIAHDQITESDKHNEQTRYLLKTIKENKNDCFHFFLYILQKEEYEYILQQLCERPAPKIESSEAVGTLNWSLSHRVKKVPDGVLNENISVRLSIEDCSRTHVEEDLFERIQSPGFGILEEAIVHGQMIPEDIYRGSIILHLRPVTDEAAQTLLNAKDNNKLLEMIFRILKKVKVEDIIDEEEPLKIKVQVQYAKSSKERQDSSLSKVALIKKRVKIHSNVLVSELEPRALASLLSKSTNLPDNIMLSVNNARSCKERVEKILSLVEAGNAGVVEDFVNALKDLEYFDIVELIDPCDIHSKAENIRKVITCNYQHILNEMQMALVRETLSKCIGDVDGIRDKCLPRNGRRRQRMSQFLQFVLQDDHNVIEFERVLKKNGLDSLLKIDENSEEAPTPNIDVKIVVEDHNSLSSKEVLFESIITLSYTGNCHDRKITLQNGARNTNEKGAMADHFSKEPLSSIDNMQSIKCCLDSIETPKLVELYRPLVVRCVKVNDVVHYLDDVIHTREREEIIEIGNLKGSTSAMEYLLSVIDGSRSSSRWTKFVDILERQGYQYVAKALSGKEVDSDVYRKYKNILTPLKLDLIERLNPEDLLYLLESEEKIIERSDTEHINAEMGNKGPMAGTIVLLDRIWRKSENWYTSFLKVLCQKKYKDLAEKMDPEFVLEWNKRKTLENTRVHAVTSTSVVDVDVKVTKLSTPVQCSNEEELKLPPPLDLESLLSGNSQADNLKSVPSLNFTSLFSGDPDTDNLKPVQGDKAFIQDIHDVEITNAKAVVKAKDKNEDETDLKKRYQTASALSVEENRHESADDQGTSLETFEERLYQNELALPAQRGENCIIIAPTGSGKTIVAVKIIKHHLAVHGIRKVAFVVEKNNLANQQSETIKRFVDCRLKVISGDTMRDEDFTELAVLLPQFDVFVITAQMLVNAMVKGDLRIESFSLIILDECHHCHGGHAFNKTMIPYHDKKLEDSEEQKTLPQIVGLTASIGVGKAKSQTQAISHIKLMMANLDANALVSVKENFAELAEKMNSPDQSILKIPSRKIDDFGALIKELMQKTEDCLTVAKDELGENMNPPYSKGNEEYTQWLEITLLKAVAKVSDSVLSRSLYTIRKYLKTYNEGLIVHSYARASDAFSFIAQNIEELQKSSKKTEIETRANALFENARGSLEVCAVDGKRCEENPLLLKLKEIILDTHREETNMRGIVFVRTRVVADIIASWMGETEELKNIKAKKYTGAQAPGAEGGITKNKQEETIKLFTKGDYKVIVATTIAEEGLDIKACNLVVKYDYAGNLISQIQAKGRGRAEHSRFFILASEDKCVAEREWMNSLKEPMMEEAMVLVQQEIQVEHEKYQMGKREMQRLAKRQRDAALHNQSSREALEGQYVLKCLKCNEYLCLSSELRKIKSQYGCISQDFKDHVFCKKSDKITYEDKEIKVGVGKIMCKKCRVNIGNIALYQEIYFPLPHIKAIKIEDDMKKGDHLKQWKKVEEKYFTVSPLSDEDLEKISESGKLVEID